MRKFLATGLLIAAACSNEKPPAVEPQDSGTAADARVADAAAAPDANVVIEDSGVEPDSAVMLPEDDAEFVAAEFPNAIECGLTASARVTVRNSGSATWTRATGYKLGAIDDSDPFAPGRVELADGDAVATGATHTFTIDLLAPAAAGAYSSDWRMVHEGVRWFGASARADITVDCPVPGDFDLGAVTILGSPDVRSYAVTSTITSLEFRPDNFHIDHTKRGQWPPVVIAPDGTTQEATVWVFFKIDGAWYGTGGERLRPNQTDKQLGNPSDIGPGWLYDPNRWGVMTNYVPAPGEVVGFMVVAGSTRSDSNVIVMERTGVVLIPFPPDGQMTAFPPFLWMER